MKHKDFQKYLGSAIWDALDEELADHTARQLIYLRQGQAYKTQRDEVQDHVAWRWYQESPAIPDPERHVPFRQLIAGILLHKYGWATEQSTAAAMDGARKLAPSLDEKFERTIPLLESLLYSPCEPPSRAPARKKKVSQYRQGDVIAIASDGMFYCAYVLKISRDAVNEYPWIEFYEPVFAQRPDVAVLQNCKAASGSPMKDGYSYRDRYFIHGLKRQPDPAGQIQLLASQWPHAPTTDHLRTHEALGAFEHLYKLKQILSRVFGNPRSTSEVRSKS